MSPDCDAALIAKTQLSLCVISATIDIILVSEAEGVVGASCNHNDSLSQHRLDQNGLVLVLCGIDAQLPLGTVATGVDVSFVGQDERVFAA